MRKTALLAAVAAFPLALAAVPASAGEPLFVPVGPGGVPGYAPRPYAPLPVVGKRVAEAAAHSVGLADVDDVDHEKGLWVVTGNDLRDRDMTVYVDAHTGRVVSWKFD